MCRCFVPIVPELISVVISISLFIGAMYNIRQKVARYRVQNLSISVMTLRYPVERSEEVELSAERIPISALDKDLRVILG